MNGYEKAFEVIADNITDSKLTKVKEINDSLAKLHTLISKSYKIPVEWNKIQLTAFCPICEYELGDNTDFEYCPYCGQRITWEEEEYEE